MAPLHGRAIVDVHCEADCQQQRLAARHGWLTNQAHEIAEYATSPVGLPPFIELPEAFFQASRLAERGFAADASDLFFAASLGDQIQQAVGFMAITAN